MTPQSENGAPGRTPLEINFGNEQPNPTAVLHPQQAQRPLKPQSKRAAVLRVFLERGDTGLTCFEAVRLAHDYVLRTTVSEMVRYHGIEFRKKYEQVPGHNGSRVDCVRYWLSDVGAQTARGLLGETS